MTQTKIHTPQKDGLGKIIGSFYPLQKQELLDMKRMGYINNLALTHLALRTAHPFCEDNKDFEINPEQISHEWGIPESSVYKAIAKLKKDGVIEITAGKIKARWAIIKNENELSDPATDYQKRESIIKNENELSDPATDYQKRESDIYIDRARGQTIQTNTDLNQTLKEDPESPPPQLQTETLNQEDLGQPFVDLTVEINTPEPNLSEHQDLDLSENFPPRATERVTTMLQNSEHNEKAPNISSEHNGDSSFSQVIEGEMVESTAIVPRNPKINELTEQDRAIWNEIERLRVINFYQAPWRDGAVISQACIEIAYKSSKKYYDDKNPTKWAALNHALNAIKDKEKELRDYNPITAIQAYQWLLGLAVEANPEAKAFVEKVEKAKEAEEMEKARKAFEEIGFMS